MGREGHPDNQGTRVTVVLRVLKGSWVLQVFVEPLVPRVGRELQGRQVLQVREVLQDH